MGRKALVTGGSRGIGAAIASRLTSIGYEVVAPPRAELDLASTDSIERYIERTDNDFDVLVNNAGINPIAPIVELTSKTIEEVLRVDLAGPIILMGFCGEGMAGRGWGRIVNVSSIWGTVSKAGRGAYSAAKSGIEGVTRTCAIELGDRGVLVNAIAPGFVKTELTVKNNSPAELEAIAASLPLRRLAEPSEIAELVLFLCSERNTFITGQTIRIDGGYSCL